MTILEVKDILLNKLHDEGCYFSKYDISIRNNSKGIKITIKGYEHIPFTMTTEKDDYFGFIVYIRDEFEERNIIFVDSKKDFDYRMAMIELGYYIGTRF